MVFFAKNSQHKYGSRFNTGFGGSGSIAQAWTDQVGGTTWAYAGKTTNQYMMYSNFLSKVNRYFGGDYASYAEFVEYAKVHMDFPEMGLLDILKLQTERDC
ncbi:hypothetical protein [Paenibacillus borealis]|uniref:hypothetical protein n=1 Tax=Paenibacillus borealis TaxID=160799 RepID=UPI00117EA041|nr:hypothetical protein [Paenibacillus borealis]